MVVAPQARNRRVNSAHGQKSFRRKHAAAAGAGGGGDFHGEPRSNPTHASSTDPEARLYKKSAGQEAKLSYLGHTLVENRNGLIAAAMSTQADGRLSAMRLD